MAFHLHRSNRVERLAEALIEIVATPVPGAAPATPESIVVQGRGMERWLAMRLAERFGVWANPDFPFPRKILRGAIAAVLGEPDRAGDAYEPQTLTWVVARLLLELLDDPAFAPIARYVADDPLGLRRFGLASRIAEAFDQYAVYRASLLRGWERGAEPADWQAALWRRIVREYGPAHIAARIEELVGALDRGRGPIAGVAARLCLFGISALPPLYVDVLGALGRRIEVHLFVFSPSAHYWADVRSRRAIIRALLRDGRPLDEEALHLETGHPLLASLGRLGRDFQAVLESTGEYDEPGADLYEDPGTATMLSTLQSDILALRCRGPGGAAPLELDAADGSISVHACHGPMREVEVLYDQLLDAFEREPDLEPHEVVVMSPAIDDYAPYVDAVFGRPQAPGRPAIPYHVADRTTRATDEVVDALVRILEVLRGRMGAAEVLDVLAIEPVRERFAIGAEDLDVLREWTDDAGIRWGVDAEHRAEARGTAVRANTWRFGLDRMLLGHALGDERGSLFAGTLAFAGVEGGEELLGRFVEYAETLFALRETLREPRPLARWKDDLGAALGSLVAVTRLNRDQHRRIRAALETLAERAAAAAFAAPVSLEVVRSALESELDRNLTTGGFLRGGVTFCALVPMRSIPFRVVCLLGMSDGAFPRSGRPPGFDRLAMAPRAGDRTQRDDDRYLFLEAILSARGRLLVTYVGHGIRDDASYPPSVVVSELLDAVSETFRLRAGTLPDDLVVHHPLQPFSRRYFAADGDRRLFSYDPALHRAAERLGAGRSARPRFLRRPLPPDPGLHAVAIDDLARFFENPARAFVRRRLGLVVDDESPAIDFRDPIDPDALARWKLGDELLSALLRGDDVAATTAALRASGAVPHGAPGEALLDEIRDCARRIAREVRALTGETGRTLLALDETIGDVRIVGALRDVWPGGQILASYSELATKRELGAWLRHLALCAREPEGVARVTRLVARKKEEVCRVELAELAPEAARAILARLIGIYRLGQTAPLPFFPNAARRYVAALAGGEAEPAARERARRELVGGYGKNAEGDDVYVRLAFGDADPLSPAFCPVAEGGDGIPCFGELARAVLADLEAHRRTS